MDNVVSIIKGRENELEFDIVIQNVKYSEAAVRFVIEATPMHFSFTCEHRGADKWTVVIPPLPDTKETTFPFHFEVIVDKYYFEPHSGTVKIVAEPTVKNSKVQPSTAEPVVKHVSVKDNLESKQSQKPKRKKPVAQKVPEKEPEKKPVKESEPEVDTTTPPKDQFADLAEQFIQQRTRQRTVESAEEPTKDDVAKRIIQQFRRKSFGAKPKLGGLLGNLSDTTD